MKKVAVLTQLIKRQGGLTLLEVMVAVSILAVISVMSYQALSVVSDSSERSQEKLNELKRLDRAWILLENDLRNALAYDKISVNGTGESIPAMQVGQSSNEYWLIFLRGGHENPLAQTRTELMRVGYRLLDEVIWRYSWSDPYIVDEELAQKQKLIEDVEDVEVRLLTPDATSYRQGPWTDAWPPSQGPGQNNPTRLPLAIEIKLTIKSTGEITRLISLAPGQ